MSNSVANGRSKLEPSSFNIKSLKLLGSTGEEFDISDMLDSVEIEESIHLLSPIYEFTFVDSANVFDALKISGNEVFTLEIEKPTLEEDKLYTFKCYTVDIPMFVKTGQSTQVYKIKAVSEQGFTSQVKRVSKPFSGSTIGVIRNIIEKELNGKISHFHSNSSGTVKGVFPNIKASSCIQMMLDRSFDEIGSPFYCFETLEDGIRLEPHTSLIQDHYDPERKYKDSSFYTEETPTVMSRGDENFKNYFEQKRKKIISINSKLGMSKLKTAKEGGISSRAISVDVSTKTVENYDFTCDKTNICLNGNPLYDSDFKLNGKELREYRNTVNEVFNINSMGYENNYLFGSKFPSSFGVRQAISTNINTISQIVTVCGDLSLSSGTVIEIVLPKPFDPNLEAKNEVGVSSNIDEYMSGKYLVVGAKHVFDKKGHFMTMKLKRDSVPVDIKKKVNS